MTSLWDLLKDWVLVAVLVTVSLAVMFAQNQTLVRGMRAGALEASARIEGTFAWVGNYLRALDTNQRLRAENIALAAEVARSREARAENTRLQSMLDLRDTTRFRVEPARIISKELSGQQNRFTINAGGRDSVEAGMPVIDERGAVLGRVALVSPSYSRVTPYLNADFRVAGKVQSLGAEGIVRWTGGRRDRLLMEHVVQTQPVLPGQRVVTSGSSGYFPPGLAIGYVDSVMTAPGRSEYDVRLAPAGRPSEARFAFVVLAAPRLDERPQDAAPDTRPLAQP